mgnify:CR=1 FL=1
MKLARMQTPEGIVTGQYEESTLIAGDGEYTPGRDGVVTYPCSPSALYCVGRNFAATLDQMDYDRPDEPDFFIKPPASLVGPEKPVRYPAWTAELTYAGELVAVIDQRCRDVAPAAVPDVVRGYTVMNDVDALDQQGRTAREPRQSATTAQMLFDPHEVVSFISRRFTLRPGDAIAFGSPANPGTIEPGDTIEITYEGVGTLTNSVVRADK